MSNRTLTYTIKLLSDIAKQANRDAQAVEGANKRQSSAYQKMARDAERASQHILRAQNQMQKNATRAGISLDRMGHGLGARLARQLDMGIHKLKQMQSVAEKTGNVLGKFGNKASALGVGAVAGGMVLKNKYQDLAQYDTGLRSAANISFANRDTAGRELGVKEIADLVKQKTIDHGGTASQALEAYETLASKGLSHDEIKIKIDDILHYRTATGAQTDELINTRNAIEQFGANGQMGLEWAMVAGKAGSNELGDQAKFLPDQLAAAGAAGMNGAKDLKEIFTLNQAAMITAGNAGTANNNVVNLLGKINASETHTDMNKQGINYAAALQAGIAADKSGLQVYAESIQQIAMKDATYRKVSAQAEAETDTEKKKILLKQQEAALGSALGLVASDRQEAMAAIAYLKQTEYMNGIKASMDSAQGVLESTKDKQTNRSGLEEKGNQVGNAKFFGEWQGMSGLMGSLGSGLESLGNWFNKHETVASVTATAATGAATLGAAGAGMWLWNTMGGKGKGKKRGATGSSEMAANALGGVQQVYVVNMNEGGMRSSLNSRKGSRKKGSLKSNRINTPAHIPELDSTNKKSKWSRAGDLLQNSKSSLTANHGLANLAGRAGGVAAAGVALYNGYQVLASDASTGQKAQGVASAAGSGLGGWGGAAMGAAIGTAILPGIGTVIGGLIGGIGGAYLGGKAGDAAGGAARNMIDGSNPMMGNTAVISSAVQSGVIQGMASAPAAMTQPPAYLNTPVLNATPQPPQPQQHTFNVQDGKLMVQVQVNPSSSLIEATARAAQPAIPLVLAGGGSTNPGGYGEPR